MLWNCTATTCRPQYPYTHTPLDPHAHHTPNTACMSVSIEPTPPGTSYLLYPTPCTLVKTSQHPWNSTPPKLPNIPGTLHTWTLTPLDLQLWTLFPPDLHTPRPPHIPIHLNPHTLVEMASRFHTLKLLYPWTPHPLDSKHPTAEFSVQFWSLFHGQNHLVLLNSIW